jgi:hypothetical protein
LRVADAALYPSGISDVTWHFEHLAHRPDARDFARMRNRLAKQIFALSPHAMSLRVPIAVSGPAPRIAGASLGPSSIPSMQPIATADTIELDFDDETPPGHRRAFWRPSRKHVSALEGSVGNWDPSGQN